MSLKRENQDFQSRALIGIGEVDCRAFKGLARTCAKGTSRAAGSRVGEGSAGSAFLQARLASRHVLSQLLF